MNANTICLMQVPETEAKQPAVEQHLFTRLPHESEEAFLGRVVNGAVTHDLHPIERIMMPGTSDQTWFCVPLTYTKGIYGFVIETKELFMGCPLPTNMLWDRSRETYGNFKQEKVDRLFRYGWTISSIDFDQWRGVFVWVVDRELDGLEVDGTCG